MWNGTTVPGSSAGSVSYPAIIALYTEDGPRFLCSWQGEEPRVSSDSHHWCKQVATPTPISVLPCVSGPLAERQRAHNRPCLSDCLPCRIHSSSASCCPRSRKRSCGRHCPTPVALCIAQPPAGSHNAREETLPGKNSKSLKETCPWGWGGR
jgi:hypothetical protein